MSLRKDLNNLIQSKGYITYQQMCDFCTDNGKKISNGERRLRESPNVKAVMGKKKSGGYAIVGYKWVADSSFTIDILKQIPGVMEAIKQGQLFIPDRSFE